MKLFRKRKLKISGKDLSKVDKTVTEIKECLYCADLKKQIKECAEKHNVKDNLKSVTKHILKCKVCRANVILITKHKKMEHN